jgi:hypothetical protein
MSDDPANVRGTEHDIAGPMDIKQIFDRQTEPDCMSACLSDDSFGKSSGTYLVNVCNIIRFRDGVPLV